MPDICLSPVESRQAALEESFSQSTSVPGSSTHRCQRMPIIQIRSCGNNIINKNNNNRSTSHCGELEVVQASPNSVGNGQRQSARQRRGARWTNPRHTTTDDPRTPPPATSRGRRKPGTSKYYGVRFRPDLDKWVAEIRVAEWRAVDKKVWLGTFETEKAAARGVDLARKLLKCTKKHRPNLPSPELTAYSKQIPANLNLTDLTATTMFKEATLFIKAECKEFAARFDDDDENTTQAHQTQSTEASPIQAVLVSPGCSDDYSDLMIQGLVQEYCDDDVMAMIDKEFMGGQWMDAVTNTFDELELMSPCSSHSSGSCVTLQQEWHEMMTGGYGFNDVVDPCNVGTVMSPQEQLSSMIDEMESSVSQQQQWEDEIYCSNWPVLPLQESYPSGQFLHTPADGSSGMALHMPSVYGSCSEPSTGCSPWGHFQHGLNQWS